MCACIRHVKLYYMYKIRLGPPYICNFNNKNIFCNLIIVFYIVARPPGLLPGRTSQLAGRSMIRNTKRKNDMILELGIKTMMQARKMDEIALELNELKFDIMALQELR